ncbi:hypothetical protein D3C71_1765420 [compost metagenome]
MGGRAAATQIVVVHCRQVVVDQRIGVDQFDRNGRCIQAGILGAEQMAGGVDQQWAHALAAAEGRVAHGLVQALRGHVGIGQGALQLLFGALQPGGKQGVSRHCQRCRTARIFPAGRDR